MKKNTANIKDCTAEIDRLQSAIADHESALQGVKSALESLKTQPADPEQSIQIGEQRRELASQGRTLREAIASLKSSLAQTQHQQDELEAHQAYEAHTQKVAQANREFARLQSALETKCAELKELLYEVKAVWKDADPAFKALQTDGTPQKPLLEGRSHYHFPSIAARHDKGWQIEVAIFDLIAEEREELKRKYRPKYIGGGGADNTRIRPLEQSIKSYSRSDLQHLPVSERVLIMQGFKAPPEVENVNKKSYLRIPKSK